MAVIKLDGLPVAAPDGKEVSSATKGSVRPDGVSLDRRSASFEVSTNRHFQGSATLGQNGVLRLV